MSRVELQKVQAYLSLLAKFINIRCHEKNPGHVKAIKKIQCKEKNRPGFKLIQVKILFLRRIKFSIKNK